MCIHRRDVTPGPVFGVGHKTSDAVKILERVTGDDPTLKAAIDREAAPVDISQWLCNGAFNGFTLLRQLPFQDVLDLAYTLIDAHFRGHMAELQKRAHDILRRSLSYDQMLAIQEVADEQV